MIGHIIGLTGRAIDLVISKIFIHNPSMNKTESSENLVNDRSGHLLVVRSDYQFTEDAVALVRLESPVVFNKNQPNRRRQEFVYYAEEAEVFFTMVKESLRRGVDVIVQTNKDPKSLGFIKKNDGTGLITRVEKLGG